MMVSFLHTVITLSPPVTHCYLIVKCHRILLDILDNVWKPATRLSRTDRVCRCDDTTFAFDGIGKPHRITTQKAIFGYHPRIILVKVDSHNTGTRYFAHGASMATA